MKLPDTNIWLALSLSGHSHHSCARLWFDGENLPGSIAFCRSTLQSMLRLLTTKGVMEPYGIEALTNKEAWSVYDSFMADDRIAFWPEPHGVDAVWKKLAARRTTSPKLWMDAYLAAFCIMRGAQLVTIDKAFTQFPGLDVCVVDLAS